MGTLKPCQPQPRLLMFKGGLEKISVFGRKYYRSILLFWNVQIPACFKFLNMYEDLHMGAFMFGQVEYMFKFNLKSEYHHVNI